MASIAGSPAAPTGVMKTSSGANMTAATRERKRAKDREAQRVSRERTKAYITHLETVVAELRQSSQKELGSTVEEQFKQQRKEIERLQRTVHKIARLAQSVASPGLGAATENDTNTRDIMDVDDQQPREKTIEMDGMRMTPEKDRQHKDSPNTNTITKQQPPSPSPSSPEDDAWQTKVMHGISPSDPGITSFLSSFMPHDLTPPNMFAALNGVITALQFCHGTSPKLTEQQDDDICIRAVFFGWESVADAEMDVIWRAVRTIDRRLYGRCRVIERAGMLRILRAMLVKIVYSTAPPRKSIPPYMNPTPLQTTKQHAPLVDLLIWPSLRDLMLAIDCTYSSQDSCLQYAEVLRFDWPFDARDMYKIAYSGSGGEENEGGEGRKTYSFTHEYESRYNDLRSWMLKQGSKCLFQRPRLSLDYCDFLTGTETSEADQRVSECCFLCETEVTALGKGSSGGSGGHEHHNGERENPVENMLKGLAAGVAYNATKMSTMKNNESRIDERYEAALGAVYPNILLDM